MKLSRALAHVDMAFAQVALVEAKAEVAVSGRLKKFALKRQLKKFGIA